MFADSEVEKHKFHQHKNPILIDHVDINKIIVSSKFPFAKKSFEYFVGHKDDRKVRPLCVFECI